MEKSSKIYVAGHTGLVGSAIKKCLEDKGYLNLVFATQDQLNLTDQKAVDDFFKIEKPEYVFLSAALVGGIMANNTLRADFIYQNIMIQSNIINASWRNKIKKLLFLGSTCIYPKNAPQPLTEDYLLLSPLEYTNEPYAIAKIAGLKMCEAFNIQYNTNFIAVMPTNLYGPGDNFNLEKSHVIPAIMRKIHFGKCLERDDWSSIRSDLNRNPIEKVDGQSDTKVILDILKKYGIEVQINKIGIGRKVKVTLWGSGTPLREFMYSLDMALACIYVMENVNVDDIVSLTKYVNHTEYHPPHFINIGTGEEISIKDLALKIKRLIGFNGEIVFDNSKPNGTMRKITDNSRLKSLGYDTIFNLDNGLVETYHNYLKLIR